MLGKCIEESISFIDDNRTYLLKPKHFNANYEFYEFFNFFKNYQRIELFCIRGESDVPIAGGLPPRTGRQSSALLHYKHASLLI